MIALQDLSGMSEQEVLNHLTSEYADRDETDETTPSDYLRAKKTLENMRVLVAYESVGSWGCDSSSFFLLQNKLTGEMFEIHGSHCSCFGFEGQLSLESTNVKALLFRLKAADRVFYTGGYDNNEKDNTDIVNDFIKGLAEKEGLLKT